MVGNRVIGTEREIIAVPGMFRMRPTRLLRNANSESRDEKTVSQLDQFRIDYRATKFIGIILVEKFSF